MMSRSLDRIALSQGPRRGPLRRAVAAAVAAGLVAGTIDVFAAALINRLPPAIILRAIASGLYGAAAFKAPARILATGAALQWAMSILIALIYALAALRLTTLVRRPILSGLAYGVGVFAVMNDIVVPLSAAPFQGAHSPLWVLENLAAMLLFGLITALIACAILSPSPRP